MPGRLFNDAFLFFYRFPVLAWRAMEQGHGGMVSDTRRLGADVACSGVRTFRVSWARASLFFVFFMVVNVSPFKVR
jgi:hypothetical protein